VCGKLIQCYQTLRMVDTSVYTLIFKNGSFAYKNRQLI
jgi:hypothetical protein